MAPMKVHELAKEFGMSSKELLGHLDAIGIPAKSHATSLVDAYVDMARTQLSEQIKAKQSDIEAQEAIKAEKEKERKANEEAQRLADEEAKRIAEEDERKRREELERRAAIKAERDAAQAAKTAKQVEREPVASLDEIFEPEPAVIEVEVSEEVEEIPAPSEEVILEPATEEPAQVAVKVEPAEPVAPATGLDGLAARIAAENARLAAEKEEKAAKAKEDKKKQKPSKPALEAKKDKSEKTKPADKRVDVVVQAEQEPAPVDDKAYYAEMAKNAEKLQRDKVLEQMRAEVAAQSQDSTSSKKKKKKKEKAEQERIAAEQAAEESEVEQDDGTVISIPQGSTVQEVAELLEVPTNDIIKRLFMLGSMLTLTQMMSDDLIELIADDLNRKVNIISITDAMSWSFEDDEADLAPRAPVVTVMGHVDHGKTSLLDAIRETGVATTEAGGITQHIGASVVQKNGRSITFIDTPGHEAFTAMRARGAIITDVVILVVAADDGVMPQTIEAISHAKAADVPIIVAVNKIDKDTAQPDTVRQMLTEYEVIPEEWGGKNIFVNVSAKKNIGIDDLLEMVLLQADILELKANPNAPGYGTVVEAKLDKGRGPVATMLVQRGTLKVGDTLVAGTAFGRVRALLNPLNETVDEAGPSTPVEVLGLGSVPASGDEFLVFTDERKARALADERAMKQRLRDQEKTHRNISLDNIFDNIKAGELTKLNLIVKADVQGSIEALRDSLDKMDQTEVVIDVIHAAVGGITETDVQLAAASNAIIIGFNVRPTPGAKAMAEEESVDVRMYRVIYQAIEEINAARVGLLAPEFKEEDTARVEVRDLFKVPKMGVIAGSYVLEGEISRDDKVRIVRDGVVIYEGTIGSLRRFKDDVKSVRQGYECGIGIEGYQDLKAGDIIESYKIVEVKREG